MGIGAALHGFVPEGWINANLGEGQWWSVPAAVLLGIPLYSNATDVIPVMETDPQVIMSYGVMSTPAVVVNEKLVHSGSIPHRDNVINWLKKEHRG